MAFRCSLAHGLPMALCALAVCTAAPTGAPVALSSSDPWSDFAGQWSPAVQAKINELKSEVQKATQDADDARTQAQASRSQEAEVAQQLAEARAQLIDESPDEANIERRIASAEIWWQVAVVALGGLAIWLAVHGHHRGAWNLPIVDKISEKLEPVRKRVEPCMKATWKRCQPLLKHLNPALEALSPALKSVGIREPLLFIGRSSANEKLRGPLSDLEYGRMSEGQARKHLKDMKVWAETSVAKAQAQEAAALQAVQELQWELSRYRGPMNLPPLTAGLMMPQPQPDASIRAQSPVSPRSAGQSRSKARNQSTTAARAQSPSAARAQSPTRAGSGQTNSASPPAQTMPNMVVPNQSMGPAAYQWPLAGGDPFSPKSAQAMGLQQPSGLTLPNWMPMMADPSSMPVHGARAAAGGRGK